MPEEFISLSHGVNGFPRKALALQSNNIQAYKIGMIADSSRKWNDVRGDTGAPADESEIANAAMLLDRADAAEEHPVANLHMPAKGRVISKDDVVADPAIMGDMGADHEEAIIADARDAAALNRTDIHRDVLRDDIVPANFERCVFALIAEMLWRPADRRERLNTCLSANGRSARNDHVRFQRHLIAKRHFRPNLTIGPNFNPSP